MHPCVRGNGEPQLIQQSPHVADRRFRRLETPGLMGRDAGSHGKDLHVQRALGIGQRRTRVGTKGQAPLGRLCWWLPAKPVHLGHCPCRTRRTDTQLLARDHRRDERLVCCSIPVWHGHIQWQAMVDQTAHRRPIDEQDPVLAQPHVDHKRTMSETLGLAMVIHHPHPCPLKLVGRLGQRGTNCRADRNNHDKG